MRIRRKQDHTTTNILNKFWKIDLSFFIRILFRPMYFVDALTISYSIKLHIIVTAALQARTHEWRRQCMDNAFCIIFSTQHHKWLFISNPRMAICIRVAVLFVSKYIEDMNSHPFLYTGVELQDFPRCYSFKYCFVYSGHAHTLYNRLRCTVIGRYDSVHTWPAI